MSPADLAVITGAASGIGEAAAIRLLARGWSVVGMDLDPMPASLAGAAERTWWVQGSVTDAEAWANVMDQARSMGRAPTTLVSSAARFGGGTVMTTALDEWQQMFDVNVFGLVRALQACLPGMVEQGRGTIVTVGSVDSHLAEQGLAAYCATKATILQITRCVAVDFARNGIRANCVTPGTVDTPAFRRVHDSFVDPQAFLAERTARNPLGRILTSDEVAQAIEYLASEASSGVTGISLTVDAGLTASFDFRSGAQAEGPASR